MCSEAQKPKPGAKVVLTELPAGLLDDLPTEDQQVISEIIGKPVLLNEYDVDGRAELEFKDAAGTIHFVYVNPKFIRSAA